MVSPESVPETFAWIGLPAFRSFVQFALLLSISVARMLPTESNLKVWPPAACRANALVELLSVQPEA